MRRLRRLLRRPGRSSAQPTTAVDAMAAGPGIETGAVDSPGLLAELDRFVGDALRRHEPGMEPLPPLRVSRRMTRTLGSFRPDRRQISLSSRLLAFGDESQVRSVLLHEAAHAITHHRDGRAPAHGRLFKSVCRELGVEPGRFVNVPAAGWTSRQRYVFTCAGCGAPVMRKRLLRVARCACGARLEVRRAARVAVDDGGRVLRVEGYARPRRR